MATVTFQGQPIALAGEFPQAGAKAPAFKLTGGDLADVGLAAFGDKVKILSIVPSLDTSVCAVSSKKFNEAIGALPGVALIVISADLPFAQKRFCESEKLAHITHLSTFRSPGFARDYGVLLAEGPLAGLTARAVLVLDRVNTIVHAQLIPEIAQEPDYDAARAAAKRASGA